MKKRLPYIGGFFTFLGVLFLGIVFFVNDIGFRHVSYIVGGVIGMVYCGYKILFPGKKDDKTE